MNPYRQQATAALRAVAVKTPTSYAWFGRASRPLPPAVAATVRPGLQREYLLDRLEAALYHSFYRHGRPLPHRPGDGPPFSRDSLFVDALSAANVGQGGWDPGWFVEADEGRLVRVTRDGLRMSDPASECRPPESAPGRPTSVRRLKEHRSLSPWFYFAFGDADDGYVDAVETRVYFNVTAAGAAPLVATATRTLNEAAVPFSLKVLNHPANFTCCDAGVLYLRRGAFSRAREPLRAVASACSPYLRPDAPAFTRPLCAGIAVAEHVPGHGESFGSSRCRLLAEGVLAAHERGTTTPAGRLDAVAERFAERGLDLDVPYLAPSSSEAYVL